MTETASALWLCNAGASPVFIWLEPWAEEFELPSRSELLIRIEGDAQHMRVAPDVEPTDTGFTIYANGGTRLCVAIDGVDQDSGSAEIEAPDFGPLSPRGFVDLVFGDVPEARPGGQPIPQKPGWIARLFGRR